MKKTAFVVCSRLDSKRIYQKPLQKINGIPLVVHLLKRLVDTKLPVYLAVPQGDFDTYAKVLSEYNLQDFVKTYCGFSDDPLARMHSVAEKYQIDSVVRVCHDKIFFDDTMFFKALDVYNRRDLDYLYSSKFIEGSGFEIISFNALEKAAQKFARIEHISYAIKSVTDNLLDFEPPSFMQGDYRFLIDYPEDIKLLEVILASIGNEATLFDAIQFIDKNKWSFEINKLPEFTVYTCAYNAEKWIEKCMGSVSMQTNFRDYEYILIDDFSTDDTPRLMARFSALYPNVTFIRNDKNIGLASSSNVGLKAARGKYIMRLDADDYFSYKEACRDMIKEIKDTGKDAIYPSNYFGSHTRIQLGKECHHIGGTIFNRRAINHIKFTDGLRGYEGLDFFERAKDVLDIGYFSRPIFFYTQHDNSMSKTNLEERVKIKAQILSAAGMQ